MFTYLTEELPRVVSTFFPVSRDNMSITGFSMGGHGALISALKTGKYKSVSALAPISNPTASERWAQKAYKEYFTEWEKEGKDYDATELIKSSKYFKCPLFIEVGTHDQFSHLLLVDNLVSALNDKNENFRYEVRDHYNHSFYYVSTFLGQHFDFHSKYLNYHN